MRHAQATFDFESAFREVLTFTPRRPGWLGSLLLTVLVIRAALVIPVLLVFALFQLLAQVLQAVAAIAAWLVGMVLLLGLGYIFLMAFLKFAAWAVH
jgi:hypothetical protein